MSSALESSSEADIAVKRNARPTLPLTPNLAPTDQVWRDDNDLPVLSHFSAEAQAGIHTHIPDAHFDNVSVATEDVGP